MRIGVLWLFSGMLLGVAMGDDKDLFEKGSVTVNDPEGTEVVIGYRFLSPERVEEGKQYPLILFVHGAGERGHDNQAQLQYLPLQMAKPEWRKQFPCYLLAPQCPRDRKWVEVDWSASTPAAFPKTPSPAMQGTLKALDEIKKKHPIDPSRIYLTGLSMGGYGSWDAASRHPEMFAAVAPICGGGDVAKASRLTKIPIWAFHGDADRAVPVARSREMIAAIQQAGGQPKYTEIPNGGHNVWTPAYADEKGLLPWMFEQRLKRDK